ncbi:MAG: VWA domain-containing protein [Clostridiaceae bacterium]|nr:VWA domain-containing protein [Clostridiaceae bacterium]HHT51733.1 VWA domain-containing protein [Bacteroidales bacterium]
MDAVWIINLSANDKILKNFEALKASFNDIEDKKFQHVHIDSWNREDVSQSIEENIKNFLGEKAEKLVSDWSYFAKLQDLNRGLRTLRIIFVGELHDSYTLRFFHLLPTALRKRQQDSIFNIDNLTITGVISYAHDVNINFSDEQSLFLTQLNMLQKNDIKSLIPFNEVYFMQQQATNVELNDIRMAQFLLFKVANNATITQDYSYNTAGVSGVYFENDIQVHNETVLLSTILLRSFCDADNFVFLNPELAENLVKNCSFVKNDKINYEKLTPLLFEQQDFSEDIEGGKEKHLSPIKNMWNVKILTDYYNGYIKELIHKLVNTWETRASQALQKFQIRLKQKKTEIIAGSRSSQGLRKDLEEMAYLNLSHPDEPAGLKQQSLVIEELSNYVEKKKKEFSAFSKNRGFKLFEVFKVPSELEDDYNRAREGTLKSDEVLKNLEGNLRTHPVISAQLIRVILVCLSLVIILGPLLDALVSSGFINLGRLSIVRPLLYIFSFILPAGVAFIQIRRLFKIIKKNQNSYKACILSTLNEKAEESILNTLVEIYQELEVECNILKEKNQKAVKNLTNLELKETHFSPNPLFQPIWQVPKSELSSEGINIHIGESGKFDEKPILKSFPGFSVKSNSEQPTSFIELIKDDQKQMDFIHELMQRPVKASIGGRSELSRSIPVNAILLLDISGSMSGPSGDGIPKIDHLRKAVAALEWNDIKWVAFSDNVYSNGNSKIFSKEVPIPDPRGGTGLHVALEYLNSIRAVEAFDKVVFISDGAPFSRELSLQEAQRLGVPIDVIYIGRDDEWGMDFMKKIADTTGGRYVLTNNINEISDSLNSSFSIQINDDAIVPFWEALKQGYYKNCIEATYNFAKTKLVSDNYSVTKLLNDHYNQDGIEAWMKASQAICAIRVGVSPISWKKHLSGGVRDHSLNIFLSWGEHLENSDDTIVQLLELGHIPALSYLLLNLSEEKEREIFEQNRDSDTTTLCKNYLTGSNVIPIFPENVNNLGFNK